MYLEFYGLKEEPFGVTPDPRFLYLSPGHREALDRTRILNVAVAEQPVAPSLPSNSPLPMLLGGIFFRRCGVGRRGWCPGVS